MKSKISRGKPLWLPAVEGRDINLKSGSASSLRRKGRGPHPVLGSGLKQRGQRENAGASRCGCPVGTGFKPVHDLRRS